MMKKPVAVLKVTTNLRAGGLMSQHNRSLARSTRAAHAKRALERKK